MLPHSSPWQGSGLCRAAQEEVVHVPKVVQQERISHQQVEQVVEVHVPMTQEIGDAIIVYEDIHIYICSSVAPPPPPWAWSWFAPRLPCAPVVRVDWCVMLVHGFGVFASGVEFHDICKEFDQVRGKRQIWKASSLMMGQ